MKKDGLRTEYSLTDASVDLISEMIVDFLTSLHVERANRIRIRLSMEEVLLRWQDSFDSQTQVTLTMTMKRRTPVIMLELPGPACDPTSASEDDLGDWANGLLSGIGLAPQFAYVRGVNTVTLKLNRRQLNPALMLLLSILVGSAIGVLGDFFLTEEMQESILRLVLDPIQNAYYRVLNVAAGPVVLFSVLAAICSVGSMTAMGKSGKRMIARFITLSTIMSVVGIVLAVIALRVPIDRVSLNGKSLTDILDFSLGLIPNDAVSPLVTGDSPQLILLAVILGSALLVAGRKAGGLVTIVNQANSVCLTIAEWVSRLTPYFVTLLLILGIWEGSLMLYLDIWKPLLLFAGISLVYLALFFVVVSISKKVSILLLLRKIMPSFWLAFKNASVDVAFGENQACCERRLGISRKLTNYGLPVGLVLFMPSSILATTLFSFYAASVYDVSVSIIWMLTCALLAVALQTATPPVAGVDLLAYAAIFTRLHVPASALTLAIVADILFTFATSALNQAMLQLDLVMEAGRMGILDEKKLKSN